MNKEEIEEYIWNLSLHGSRWLAEELYKLQQENQGLKKQLKIINKEMKLLEEEKERFNVLISNEYDEDK